MGFKREFNWQIITKKDEQLDFIKGINFINCIIVKDEYREYPMHIPIEWKHKEESKGFYEIDELSWKNNQTIITIRVEKL